MGITYNSKKNNQCANTRKLNKYTEDNNLIPYTDKVSHMEGIITQQNISLWEDIHNTPLSKRKSV